MPARIARSETRRFPYRATLYGPTGESGAVTVHASFREARNHVVGAMLAYTSQVRSGTVEPRRRTGLVSRRRFVWHRGRVVALIDPATPLPVIDFILYRARRLGPPTGSEAVIARVTATDADLAVLLAASAWPRLTRQLAHASVIAADRAPAALRGRSRRARRLAA